MKLTLTSVASCLTLLVGAFTSCEDNKEAGTKVVLENRSVTPALLKKLTGFENVEVFSLIGSDDVLSESPSFVFGGSADGAGFLTLPDGGYALVTNHEDNFSVSRVTFDETLKPIKGEYIMNSDGGQWRLCSATLATTAEHGFSGFLTCGESGEESRTNLIDPLADAGSKSQKRDLPGFGRWSAENAVPLPKDAYNKTVVIIGDDDDATYGGQVAMYVSNTVGDLTNGKLYVLRAVSQNTIEKGGIVEGTSVPVEFVEVTGHTTLTGAQINARTAELKAIAFGRVEDIDYRKGGGANSREIYFNVTGQNNTGVNAGYTRSKYGRVYKLVLNATDPLKGSLDLILDGDDRSGKAKDFQNPDNIVVTNNFIYIQEDPNAGYNDQTHDAYIYQYNIGTKELKKAFELDHKRTASDAVTFNNPAFVSTTYPQPVAGMSGYGSWEYGAMIDISEIVGISDVFMLAIQPHTWRSDDFKNPDGGTIRPNESQASQIVILKGVVR